MYDELSEKQRLLLRVLATSLEDGIGTEFIFMRAYGRITNASFVDSKTKPYKPDIWQDVIQHDLDTFVDFGFFTPKNVDERGQISSYNVNINKIINAVKHNFEPPTTDQISIRFKDPVKKIAAEGRETSSVLPPEIQNSLAAFQQDYPDSKKTAFIMMRFSETQTHKEIVSAIKSTLEAHGIQGIRADDKEYHDDLFWNIVTFIYGCGFGIAVFEQIEKSEFNPNVSLEVGYMLALKKPVCLLKDETLKALHSDLIGKLYRDFDSQNILKTVQSALSKWVSDRILTRNISHTSSILAFQNSSSGEHLKELTDFWAELSRIRTKYVRFCRGGKTNPDDHANIIAEAQKICARASFYDEERSEICLDLVIPPNATDDQISSFKTTHEICKDGLKYISQIWLTPNQVAEKDNLAEYKLWGEYETRNINALNHVK